ncbi:MAG: leucine-rich repeat domain-containing protein, partial [Rikenellaceae bacterium]
NANGDKDINVVMLNLESVPEKAFYRCSDLTSIELPVATTIGDYAFYSCTALSSIELPVATTIRERAFYYCKALTSISLGDEGNGVSSILTSVFLYVTTENIDLTIKVAEDSDITISGTILNTGYNTYTFKSINGYEEWALANFTAESYPESKTWYVSNTTAETDDFAGLKAALATANTNKDINVVMLNLESLPNGAFNECTSLSSIELPAAKAIGYYAFYGCTSLTSIELPEVTTLREFTFESCSALTSIELPKATTIETSAFYSCTALSSISLGDEGDGVSSIWGDAFSGVTTSNIYLTIKVAGSTISISGTTLNTGYNTYTFNSITVAE